MKFDEISKNMREFLGYFEVFRRLGYPADDICMLVARSPVDDKPACFAVLVQDKKQFLVEIGPCKDIESAELTIEYAAVCAALDDGSLSTEDHERIWNESAAKKNAASLTTALALKGFRAPITLN